jgi:hypothetical protein
MLNEFVNWCMVSQMYNEHIDDTNEIVAFVALDNNIGFVAYEYISSIDSKPRALSVGIETSVE